MIKTEHVTIRGREFVRTCSDAGRYVVRDGVSYTEAVDPVGSGRVYTEGDVLPPEVAEATEAERAAEAAAAEALAILRGEAE